jgi:hypothetical protein
MRFRIALQVSLMALAATACFGPIDPASATESPERVTFPSADGKTTLTGYLFRPATAAADRVPAVVMMHGRAGAYSILARGVFDASTLSQRHRMWGRLLAEQGYPWSMDSGPAAIHGVSRKGATNPAPARSTR